MARISVEQAALTDIRYIRLGLSLGAEREQAQAVGLWAAIHVWNDAQERGRYKAPIVDIDDIGTMLGFDDFAQKLCDADLAEKQNGIVRIKGTKGRIEWLEKSRKNGKKGAIHGKKGGRPKNPPGKPQRGLLEKPPVDTPSFSSSCSFSASSSCSDSDSDSAKTPANQKQNQTPPTPPRGERANAAKPTYPPGFLRAWDAYPHNPQRRDKKTALARWKTHKLESQAESVMRWIYALQADENALRDARAYVKGFAAWISAKDFSDDPPQPERYAKMTRENREQKEIMENWLARKKRGESILGIGDGK